MGENSRGAQDGFDKAADLERRIAELEKAERAKNEFLAILSHELRNPIHAIRTNAWLIKSRTKDVEVTRPADAIDRQVMRLSKILDDLLDVIKVSRTDELAFKTVSVQQVTSAAVEATRKALDTHRRELTVALPNTPLYVKADPARLEQAIGNLLGNAVKYSPQQGEITVTVAEDRGQAMVSVRDRGVGIPADELPQIFKLFGQGASAKKDGTQGLGIGLHIARELVEAHGGTVEARSEGAGKGSEFIIRVPLTLERPVGHHASYTGSDGAPALRILVVDDNRDSADSMAKLLEVYGHTALVAYDGESALAKAEKMRPHVALVDIGMPAMNGYEVARRISSSAWGKGTLLVAVTGWGTKSDRSKSQEAGFAYHLTKPVDYSTLATLLSTAARKSAV